MKTLDQIINDGNYNRLNGALVERSKELAKKIRIAMRSAEITEIGDYSILTVKSYSGFSDTALYIRCECDFDGYPETEYRSLEQSTSSYFAGDFNCWVVAAKGRDRLKFLNDARSILDAIDAIKAERIANVEQALIVAEPL